MTHKTVRFSIFCILLCMWILPISCRSRPDKVIVGVALTQDCHYGVQIALREINAAGGIDGIPMEVVLRERDQSEPDNAEKEFECAQRFAANNDLIAVIGHADSVGTINGASLYNQAKIPQIVTISTSSAITNIGDWTYRLCLSDEEQGPALAEHAVKNWGKSKIAVIYANDDYGRGISQAFTRRALELGAQIGPGILIRRVLTAEDKEFLRLRLERLQREEKPDLIALFQNPDDSLWIINTIRQLGMQVDILGGDTLSMLHVTSEYTTIMEGVRFARFFYANTEDVRSTTFMQDYRELAGVYSGNTTAALAYDAIYLVRDAVLHGGLSRSGVKSYLDRLIREKIPFDGVAGSCLIGPDHDAKRQLYIVESNTHQPRLVETVTFE